MYNQNGNGNNNSRANNQGNRNQKSNQTFQKVGYQTELTKINQSGYVDEAEKVIRELKRNDCLLSTSKIRGILSLVSDLNDQLILDSSMPSETIKEKCGYIRMRFAYECGRDKNNTVNSLVKNACLIELLKEIDKMNNQHEIREQAKLFCKFMEALVAYHKFYGGDDK